MASKELKQGGMKPSTLSIKVTMGEEVDSHPIYLVKLSAPSINKNWTVAYRFRNFKDFQAALTPSDLEMMKSSFPESKLKSKFGMLGVSLSKEEFAERTQRLDQWLSELVAVREHLSSQTRNMLTSFLNLNNLQQGELDSMVISRPSTENTASDGTRSIGPSPPVVKVLAQGLPLIQHKFGAKLGQLVSRPLILRLSGDLTHLSLIEMVDGVGYMEKKTMEIDQISEVFGGILTPNMEKAVCPPASGRRGSSFMAAQPTSQTPPGTQAERERRCFSLVAPDATWDLELVPLFMNVLDDNTSLRDQLVTCIRMLCPMTKHETNFIKASKFNGRKRGFVFKLGKQGIGYYRDVLPVVQISTKRIR